MSTKKQVAPRCRLSPLAGKQKAGQRVIAVVKKTFRFRDAFFASTAYAAILFAERNYDKRYNG
jgi:hypothetical protein